MKSQTFLTAPKKTPCLRVRELTFCDIEFEESEISSIDKIQHLIDQVIEFSDEERTSHMILNSSAKMHINGNLRGQAIRELKLSNPNIHIKRAYEEVENETKISINNLGNLVTEPSQKKLSCFIIIIMKMQDISFILMV